MLYVQLITASLDYIVTFCYDVILCFVRGELFFWRSSDNRHVNSPHSLMIIAYFAKVNALVKKSLTSHFILGFRPFARRRGELYFPVRRNIFCTFSILGYFRARE
nr:MAG TPA: hypothetical protein [Caudoviricetes sp.]